MLLFDYFMAWFQNNAINFEKNIEFSKKLYYSNNCSMTINIIKLSTISIKALL